MFVNLMHQIKQAIQTSVEMLRKRLAASTKPTNTLLVRGSLRDLVRAKPQLIAESALLRQQLIVLNRSVKRPQLTKTDRSLLVLLASRDYSMMSGSHASNVAFLAAASKHERCARAS